MSSISSILNFGLENSSVRFVARTPNPDLRKLAVRTLALVLWLAVPTRLGAATVRAWEGAIDLPTYALGEEDPNPAFPLVKGHRVYPYTMLDDLTDRLE